MKSQKKYRVGAYDVKFQWMDDDWCDDAGYEGMRCGGSRRLFKIARKAPDPMEALLHEVLHEINGQCSLKLTERQVNTLSYFGIAFCRDNNVDLREELTEK